MEEPQAFENRTNLDSVKAKIEQLKEGISKTIVGQNELIEQLIICLLADGHALLEGVPGIAKTLAAKTMANMIKAEFGRIQFTPDLMPSDILGTSVYNMKKNEFEFKSGPIFTEVLLIDEINRAPAKTQAALFEVMEERQVTIDGKTNKMGDLFFALATQNPIEQEGTYRLPEAQLDRFLFKIVVDYPDLEEEVAILNYHHRSSENKSSVDPVLDIKEILELRKIVKRVVVEEKLIKYIAELIQSTRKSADLYLGASPRASIAILNTAKVKAVLSGRDFVIPEDIQYVANPALRHRVILSPEREMEGMTVDEIISRIFNQVEVPK
ncbi:MAG: MoxR-like ATPase [Cyclobacteriaceae bacterium]|jgi:MoxR-like ATPase